MRKRSLWRERDDKGYESARPEAVDDNSDAFCGNLEGARCLECLIFNSIYYTKEWIFIPFRFSVFYEVVTFFTLIFVSPSGMGCIFPRLCKVFFPAVDELSRFDDLLKERRSIALKQLDKRRTRHG